jgi:ATP synthase protein I
LIKLSASPLQKVVQDQAFAIVYWQMAGVIAFASLLWPLFGTLTAFSVLSGGFAYCLPTLLFVWRVFRYSGAQQMNQFMAAFFIGEMIKLFLSGLLFLLVVKYLPVSLLSVLVGFAGAIVLFWIVCVWRFARQETRRNNNST